MTRPGLLEGAGVALAASVLGDGARVLLVPVAGRVEALHAVIAGIGLAYLLYLVARSRVRAGRIAVPAAWVLATSAAALLEAGPVSHVLVQCALAVLARTLCFHRGVLPAMADLALMAAGLAAAAFALLQGAGLALAIWSLMLVQSLFVLIPSRRREGSSGARPGATDERFERAHRAAESAVRRLGAGI